MRVKANNTALEYVVTLTPEERRQIVSALDEVLFEDGELLEEYGTYPGLHPLAALYYALEIEAEEVGDLEEAD